MEASEKLDIFVFQQLDELWKTYLISKMLRITLIGLIIL
jgi:hypothetical protein